MMTTTKARRGVIGLALGAAMLATSMLPAAASTDTGVTRLAGQDRYETAATVSQDNFAPGVAVAYIASGEGFADALAGAPAAGIENAPVLLVRTNQVPSDIAKELTRLKPAKIVVLGGSAAVSDDVAADLEKYTAGSVTRLSGEDRYTTSAEVSKATFKPGVQNVYIASGADYADALAGAPLAAAKGGPVLLVQPGRITDAVARELERLRPNSITILGGTAAVSDAVHADLGKYSDNLVARISGDNRYETANQIATRFPAEAAHAYVASGETYADALAAAPVAGAQGVPVYLARANQAFVPIQANLQQLVLVGGTSVLSPAVENQLKDLLASANPTPTPEPEPTDPGVPGEPEPEPTTPAPDPSPTPDPTPTPPVTYDPPAGYDGQMFRLINSERAKAGVAPVAYWDPLRSDALRHSRWMLNNDTMEHASPADMRRGVESAGCGTRWAENIGWTVRHSTTDASILMDMYMDSPGHKANILDPQFKYVATGTVVDGDLMYNTQRFAATCS